jgi:hypothetical protein
LPGLIASLVWMADPKVTPDLSDTLRSTAETMPCVAVYPFQGNQKPGDTNGQGLTAFGGGWFALSPPGTQVSGQPSSSGGGGGY